MDASNYILRNIRIECQTQTWLNVDMDETTAGAEDLSCFPSVLCELQKEKKYKVSTLSRNF